MCLPLLIAVDERGGHRIFWLVKCSSRMLEASQLYDTMFCHVSPLPLPLHTHITSIHQPKGIVATVLDIVIFVPGVSSSRNMGTATKTITFFLTVCPLAVKEK
jgi:hypothetical protein